MTSTVLKVSGVSKSYFQGEREVPVLKDLNLEVQEGETVAIVGPSGSGKSTLLGLLAGLDRPSSGTLSIKGQDLARLSLSELATFRARHIGIVFQQFHLLPHLTALENVELPLQIQGKTSSSSLAKELLNQVGLSHRLDHFPSEMSGGENQRVALARALVVEPSIVLADEPSGNLDEATSETVMNLLFELVKRHKSTLLLVTHNLELAERCGRQMNLKGGRFL